MPDVGSPVAFRQMPSEGQPVVAFDFDGTLTVRDSFTAFLRWNAGSAGWAAGLTMMAPAAAAYIWHRDRGRIKAAAVKQFLLGMEKRKLESQAEQFAGRVWTQFMRPDALACWEDWGREGAYRVIVTASPETTVAPFARRLGAEGLIGTRLLFDADDRVTGAFASANCRGEEKVSRLREAFGADMTLAAAYGDTSGDHEMLQIAQEAGFRRFRATP